MAPRVRKIETAGRQNSLGLTASGLEKLLNNIENEPGSSNASRSDARWPFRQPAIVIRVVHPGGSDVEVRMACRNLSKNGMCLLHSAFVYPGTRCVCVLPHPERGGVPIEGEIVRCQHRSGVVHEVGIRFDDEIDVRAFVDPDPIRQLFAAENVKPEDLKGTVLYVESNQIDSTLLKHHLTGTCIEIVPAKTAAEALAAVHGGVDLILSEFVLEDMTGSEFALQLRSENISTPLIFVTHDIGPRVINAVKRKLAQAMIRKPVTAETLLPALAEFIQRCAPESAAGSASAGPVDPKLAEALKAEIARCADQIETAVSSGAAMEIVGTCHVLRQVSEVIGMSRLSGDATKAIADLSENMNVDASKNLLAVIIEQCRRAA